MQIKRKRGDCSRGISLSQGISQGLLKNRSSSEAITAESAGFATDPVMIPAFGGREFFGPDAGMIRLAAGRAGRIF
jgi:hypothetical protein